MTRASLALLAALLLALAAPAGADPAVTVKPVDLRETPASDAKVVGTVAAETAVEVVGRQGAWVQLRGASGTGWAKLFDVRMGTGAAAPAAAKGSAMSSIAQTLNLATGKRDASVATGVRGLDEKMLANAQPNEAQIAVLMGYTATPEQAQAFAKTGKLVPREVAPIGAAPAATGAPAK